MPKPSADEYPKFFRQGTELVKIGWSKRENQEYVHKAPQQVVHLLADTVAHLGDKGALFASDAVLPLVDRTTGTEVPAYQSYLSIAWLRATGLLEQHGRQGYTLKCTREIRQAVDELWSKLPTRKL